MMTESERTFRTNVIIASISSDSGHSNFEIKESHSYDDLAEKARQDLERPEYARTFFLGFDLKKTPSNHWYVVEVNGRHTGLQGLERLNPDFSEQQFADSIRQRYGITFTRHSEILMNGFTEFIGRYPKLQHVPEEEKLDMSMHIVQACADSLKFNEERFEGALVNKINHKNLLPENFIAPFVILDGTQKVRDLRSWIRIVTSQHPEDFQQGLVVVKSPTGLQGREVFVHRLHKLTQEQLPIGYMVEPFIKSALIVYSKDGLAHDGCMRFGIIANIDNDSKVDFTPAGGYWRLSPQSTINTKTRLKNRYTANLSRGAFAQNASEEDVELARVISEDSALHMFSKFYQREFTKKS